MRDVRGRISRTCNSLSQNANLRGMKNFMADSKPTGGPSPWLYPPDEREHLEYKLKAEKLAYGGENDLMGVQTPNVHGCIPRFYEPGGPWTQFECPCGQMFWARGAKSQARSCRQQGKQCRIQVGGSSVATGGRAPTLALAGNTYGSLMVTGHERGKGWKVKCACGRERSILNGTLLANGGYKTCGACTEQERARGMHEQHREVVMAEATLGSALSSIGAPSSSLRESDVVANLGGLGAMVGVGGIMCRDGHQRIWYEVDATDGTGHDELCPLCMALARIELLES